MPGLLPVAFVSDNEIALSPEHARLLIYFGYCAVIGTGIAVTSASGAVEDYDATLINLVYGYNNICVYFDFAPATYVLPLMWPFASYLIAAYGTFMSWFARTQVDTGVLTPRGFQCFRAAKVFETVTALVFSLVFAVKPPAEAFAHPKWKERLVIHTVPFFAFQCGMVSLAISTSFHGVATGYYASLGLPARPMAVGSVLYCVLFVLSTAAKLVWSIWALAATPWTPPRGLAGLSEANDRVWLVLAVLVPLAKSLYIVCARSSRVAWVHVHLSSSRCGKPHMSAEAEAPATEEVSV